MGLSYFYTFSAPRNITAAELERFLRKVERAAKRAGFRPTLVLNAVFTTPEEKQFVRRITSGIVVSDPRLKGPVALDPAKASHHDREIGECRIMPERGILLVVTDEQGGETVFGFFSYPDDLCDVHGSEVAHAPCKGRWFFHNYIDSPDPRYRKLVQLFAEAGFLERERDEYVPR